MAKTKKKLGSIFDSDFLDEDAAATAVDGNALYGDLPPRLQEIKKQAESIVDGGDLPQIAIELLQDNPYQPRRRMNEKRLEGLTQEIRNHSFRGVLLARPHPDDPNLYQLVYGHRRREAAKRAGLIKLPVMIQDITDQEMMFLAANENLMRDDLSPVDEAYMYQSMQELLTQEQIAERLQVSRGYIRNRLELLKAPEDVQDMVEEKPATIRAAYFLRKVDDSTIRKAAIQALLTEEITGSQVEAYLQNLLLAQQQKNHLASEEEIASEDHYAPDLQPQTVPSIQNAQDAHAPSEDKHLLEQSRITSSALKEQSKIETIGRQLESYEKRLRTQNRTPSEGEHAALQKVVEIIERLRPQS